MQEVQQVWPVEAAEPAGLLSSVRLKPYQKQCLAFMLGVERSSDPNLEGVRKPCVAGTIAGRTDKFRVRGGWLTSEVGMGKTMVSISLILANPLAGGDKPTAAECRKPVDESDDEGPAVKKLAPGTWGVTLILAPVSLLGQWMDELKQFAPQLKVANVHGSGKARVDAIAGADVLLCAATSGQGALNGSPASRRPIHRMIIDEAHTLSRGFSSAAAGQLFRIGARHVWLLTGTPLTTSVQELRKGAQLLGQYEAGLRLCENGVGPALVAKLKQLMIRHTKSMRIGGEIALALPESDVSTVWLTMNATERRVYDKAKAAVVKQFRLEASQAVSIDMRLSRLRATCANAYGKVAARAVGVTARCEQRLFTSHRHE